MVFRFNGTVCCAWLLSIAWACAQDQDAWRDPSDHRVQFVSVDRDVQLEVLDWGGSGPEVVLLAGSGNTAHVFDGFAEKLGQGYRVVGITRRGYGASSRPNTGYGVERLGADVGEVLDALDLVAPVLMGHSFGGREMTALEQLRPGRIRGLIYIDSTADPTYDWSAYQNSHDQLPASMRPQPSAADRESFHAFQAWQLRNRGFAFPESELRNIIAENPDGAMGRSTASPFVHEAIGAGMAAPDFSGLAVPVLAFFVLPSPVDEQLERYRPQTKRERDAIEQTHSMESDFARRAIRILRRGVPTARVIELQGAKHHAFLSNEADILREARAFLETLP